VIAAALLAVGMLMTGSPALAQGEPVVRAILFWDESCSNCEIVLNEVLPPLEEEYGSRLHVLKPEITTLIAYDLFLKTVEEYDIPEDQKGVPLLVIGDEAMVGWDAIDSGLRPEIERGLTAGGLDYPERLGLTAATAAQLEEAARTALESRGGEPTIDLTAAWVVFWASLIGLAYVGAGVYAAPRRTLGSVIAEASRQQSLFVGALALAGTALAVYLSIVELTGRDTICPVLSGCDAVQHSPYAKFFGIPVAAMGVAGFGAILGLWIWGRLRQDELSRLAPLAIFGLALAGTVFSAYLTYLEIFVIHAVCAWCLGSALFMTLILVLSYRDLAAQPAAGTRRRRRKGRKGR
jgi:uncharacterized membrane protein